MKTKSIIIVLVVLVVLDYLIAQANKNPKVICKGKLPFNYNAQTLPPFGIAVSNEDKGNELLMKHELVHWDQYRKTGAIFYYLRYGIEKVIYGYDNMPMEIEARRTLGESDYCLSNYTECVRNGNSITIKDSNFRT